eukprot:754059_1
MASTRTSGAPYVVITAVIALVSSQSYILYDYELLAWQDGNAFCAFSYGTSLASIHDATQDNEADLECPTSAQLTGCWIGATILDPWNWETNDGIWKWSDGTPFNYGSNTSGGIPPWKTGNPSNHHTEFCGEIDKATVGWNDNECYNEKPILCNSPSNSSSIVIDDNINNVRQPMSSHSVGKMDILDDVHVQFDFKVLSIPIQTEANILHIGSDLYPRIPSVSIYNASPLELPTLSVWFSVIAKADSRIQRHYISIAKWHHLSFDITQSTVVISLDGVTVKTINDQSSHAILFNEDIYILSHPNYTSMNGLVRDVKITTNNAYLTPFNYLCDYDNRFTSYDGSWSSNVQCWLQQSNYDGGTAVWLGDKDTTSIQWTDYIIEFAVMMIAVDDSTAHAGVLFRALSVNGNLNGGQQYLVDLKKTSGIRLSTVDNGALTEKYLDPETINVGQYYTVRVEVVGLVVSVYLDNRHRFDAFIDEYSHGSIGLRTHHCQAVFTRLRIIFPNTNSRITLDPTTSPTRHPTSMPTGQPTAHPTSHPTYLPTAGPTLYPTEHPTIGPTLNPTNDPSHSTSGTAVPNTSKEPIIESTISLDDTMVTVSSTNEVRDNNAVWIYDTILSNLELSLVITAAVCICLVVCIIVCVKRRVQKERQDSAKYIIPVNSNSDGSQMVSIPVSNHVVQLNIQPEPATSKEKSCRDITEVTEWLTKKVKLPQYVQNFVDNGFETMEFVCDITAAEDLKDIGVTLKGHQIRILAKVKDLKAQQTKHGHMVVKDDSEHKPPRSVLDELEGDNEMEEPLTLEGSSPQKHCNDAFINIQGGVTLGSLSQDHPLDDQTGPIEPKM